MFSTCLVRAVIDVSVARVPIEGKTIYFRYSNKFCSTKPFIRSKDNQYLMILDMNVLLTYIL